MPNLEIIRQWVAALRSGEYVQGDGVLRDDEDKFCCLGVLCDLHSRATGDQWKPPAETHPDSYTYVVQCYIPPKVADWVGLPPHYGGDVRFSRYAFGATASNLNDAGSTFVEIADVIEREFLNA